MWTDEDIRQEFDSNFNITIQELAAISGKTVKEVKRILLER